MKILLQTTLLPLFISSLLFTQSATARTIEVDVHGMTCAFCVDSLERKFNNMETVSKVDVSLKLKKIRLETDADLPTEETIKQAVLDTGFTPIKITVLPDKKTTDTTNVSTPKNTAVTNNKTESK